LAASKKNICLKDPRRDLDTNGKGTLKLLQMAKKNGAKKFIFSSTGSVYGDCGRDTISETTPLNPCSYYGISKEAGDRYVQYFSKEGLLDTTVLRYFHIYGPRQDWGTFGGVVAIWINNVLVGKGCVLSGDRNITRTFTYVGDVVEANIRAIETEPGTVLNISSGEQTALWALYTRILLTTKKECNISIAPGLVGDVGYYDVNNRESKKALGLKYTDFIPGLKETVHWHKERLGL
jgi:nucleoside-diphosphate-sugar epimerase